MNETEQLKTLQGGPLLESFVGRIKKPLYANEIGIFQINLGNRCNLTCKHCHVQAGPAKNDVMPLSIINRCVSILGESHIPTIDITGGAPEMNPHFQGFLENCATLKRRLLVRSNLAILMTNEYRHLVDLYAKLKVEIVTSLPSFEKDKTDRQRGQGVYEKVIDAMKALNQKGYGQPGSGLVLDLVHNPTGAYLPGSQKSLHAEYAHFLNNKHGVVFNSLFSITNMPIGRYLEYLLRTDNFEEYMETLIGAFNPAALDSVMCKNTLSVGWDGTLYDCDFNQMLKLPVNHGAPDNIMDFDYEKLKCRQIVVGNHCYGCTAGAGSSCQGEVVE